MAESRTDLSRRFLGTEVMDDLEASGRGLIRSLHELRQVNRFLGGNAAILRAVRPYLLRRRPGPVRILDLGTGIGDVPARLVEWGAQRGVAVDVTAVEGNPFVAQEAEAWLDVRLPGSLRQRVRVIEADVWKLPTELGRHDVVLASLFLHHMPEHRTIPFLRLMKGLASDGILVNDLHRNRWAYMGISAIGRVFRASEVFQHDGPLSVRRGFTRSELKKLAAKAGLHAAEIRWHWAFRWTLSTVG